MIRVARIPSSHHARVGRAGKSLIEMLVIISILAALMTPTMTLISTLLRTQRSTEELIHISRTVGEFGRQFARDVRWAQAMTPGPEADHITRLDLTTANGTTVRYDWSGGDLVRTRNGKHRREFVFGRRVRYTLQADKDNRVELAVHVPAELIQTDGSPVRVDITDTLPTTTYRFLGRVGPSEP